MEQLEQFLKIEEKYNLYEKEVDGINFWVYTRFSIWRDKIRAAEGNLEKAHSGKKRTLSGWVKTGVNMGLNILKKGKCSNTDIDLLIFNHERRVLNNDVYECKYTECLSDYYNNSVVVEHPHDYEHLKPVRTENILYVDAITVWSCLYAKLQKMIKSKEYKNLYSNIENIVREPLRELESAYEVKLNIANIINLLVYRTLLSKIRRKYYAKLLEQLRPKAIVEVVGYSLDHMIVNELAKEKGIPTIELQHGAISEWHCAYRYYGEKKVKQLPDYFFSFSDYWKDFVKMPTKVISVGFPYFDMQRGKYALVHEDKRKKIIFLSQGTIGKKLSRFAYQCYKCLKNEEYEIIYKLHPGEYAIWKDRYPYLLECEDMRVIDNGKIGLYEYFAECSIQVGVYSTALYEGLGFNLRTFIYYIEGSFSMNNLCEKGFAEVVYDEKDFIKKMNKHIGCKERENVSIWKENPVENMCKEVEQIMV